MGKTTSPMISILLPTYNSAATVRETLESVCWADEILVVDSFSNDETVEICRTYGILQKCSVRIVQHEYINSARQKNWAIPQCSQEWILQIDTDEVPEPGLKEEILHSIEQANDEVHGFKIPFKHHVLGEWVRHGGFYPEFHLRLFRRDFGRFEAREVHAHVQVPGKISTLNHHILHYGMPSLSRQLANLNRYTRYEADELARQGRKFSAYRLLIHPWVTFAYRYFWQQGFRDGWRGLVLAGYAAIYQFLVWAKRWEMEELDLEKSPS